MNCYYNIVEVVCKTVWPMRTRKYVHVMSMAVKRYPKVCKFTFTPLPIHAHQPMVTCMW